MRTKRGNKKWGGEGTKRKKKMHKKRRENVGKEKGRK